MSIFFRVFATLARQVVLIKLKFDAEERTVGTKFGGDVFETPLSRGGIEYVMTCVRVNNA